MAKRSAFIFILMLVWPAVCLADLTGKWSCNDGGMYYLRQVGNALFWYGERSTTKPAWSNVLTAAIEGDRIRGQWTDVPKGRTKSRGKLDLAIQQGGNVLVAIKKSGGFGGSKWQRVGYRPPPNLTGSISGRATGPRADAASVFSISLYGPNDDRIFRKSQRFDGSGRYRFSGLPKGRYLLTVGTKADIAVGPRPSRRSVECSGRAVKGVNFEFR